MLTRMVYRHFRGFERRAISVPARLFVAASTKLRARVVNLGLGGAALEVAEYVHVGARVELELQPANLWDPLLIDATITWVRETASGFSAGVVFEHQSSRAMGSLLGLLSAEVYS